jgi:hypothetical protein
LNELSGPSANQRCGIRRGGLTPISALQHHAGDAPTVFHSVRKAFIDSASNGFSVLQLVGDNGISLGGAVHAVTTRREHHVLFSIHLPLEVLRVPPLVVNL